MQYKKNSFADDPEAYNNRGNAKGILGHFQEAKRDLQTALELARQAGDESLAASIEQFLQSLR